MHPRHSYTQGKDRWYVRSESVMGIDADEDGIREEESGHGKNARKRVNGGADVRRRYL